MVVIGGGLMGAGIAQVAAQTGHKVTLVDISQQVSKEIKSFCLMKCFPKVLDKSNARISESIKRVAKKQFADDADAAGKFIDRLVFAYRKNSVNQKI